MITQADLVQRFVNGATKGMASNLFAEGDVLYSYGHHFPLLLRLNRGGYLVNGDYYSVSTSAHQAMVFEYGPQVPFSALRSAWEHLSPLNGSSLAIKLVEELQVVEALPDNWEMLCGCGNCKERDMSESPYGCPTPRYRHSLGLTLVELRGSYLLSGIDSTQRQHACSLILLPHPCGTVKDALQMLMPPLVFAITGNQPVSETVTIRPRIHHEGSRRDTPARFEHGIYAGGVRRQGEWWFIPSDTLFAELTKEKNYQLAGGQTANHRASFGSVGLHGRQFVRGVVRHLEKEHYTIHLGNTWHLALRNLAVKSWTAKGRVD